MLFQDLFRWSDVFNFCSPWAIISESPGNKLKMSSCKGYSLTGTRTNDTLVCCFAGCENRADLLGWPSTTLATMAGMHGCSCNTTSKGAESTGKAIYKYTRKYLVWIFFFWNFLYEWLWLIFCTLWEQLDAEFREYETSFQQNGEGPDFPAKALTGIIEVCMLYRWPLPRLIFMRQLFSGSSVILNWALLLQTCVAISPEKDRVTLERLVEPLLFLSKSYGGGREGHACNIVQTLFNGYLLVEELFNENDQVRFWGCLTPLFWNGMCFHFGAASSWVFLSYCGNIMFAS